MGAVDNFTLVTGIASLVGFAIQIFDLFPRHADRRRDLLLLMIGLFVGSAISGLSRSEVVLNVGALTPMQVLMGAVAAVSALLLLSARFQKDSDHRQETYLIGSMGTGVLLVLLIGYGVYNSDGYDPRREFTLDEQLVLVRHAREAGNIDRAINILDYAKRDLKETDPRFAAIEKQISDLAKSQVR